MRTIISIEHVEELKDKDGEPYWRTHAIADDGSEVVGFGKDFDVDMRIEVFYHHGQVKMRQYTGKDLEKDI